MYLHFVFFGFAQFFRVYYLMLKYGLNFEQLKKLHLNGSDLVCCFEKHLNECNVFLCVVYLRQYLYVLKDNILRVKLYIYIHILTLQSKYSKTPLSRQHLENSKSGGLNKFSGSLL